ncbi:MAG: phage tail tip lysozyme [Candidatus Saccharimonas sp.]
MKHIYLEKRKWNAFLKETRRTTRDVFILVSLLVITTVGDPAIARAALDQDFLSNNNAPFLGPSDCEPPKQAAVAAITPEIKVAQTFIVGFDPGATEQIAAAVEKYKLGGVFPVGGDDNSKLTKDFFDSLNTKAGAKLFIAADDEGGRGNGDGVARFTKNIIPTAEEMGKLSAAEAKAKGEQAGKILADMGLTGDLAPVVDIANPGTPWTAAKRNWSSNPDTIIANAGGFAEGLKNAGITPVYKHFPGIGQVKENTDYKKTSPQNLTDYLEVHGDIKIFKELVNKNSGAVMLSNGYVDDWGDKPVGINEKAVQYLRTKLNFQGTIMTDALNALSQDGYGSSKIDLSSAVVAALNAGVDMPLFIPSNIDGDIDAAIKKVIAEVPGTVIDKAYQKSLSLRGLSASTVGNVDTPATDAVTCCASGATPSGSVTLAGNNNTEKILNFLMNNPKYQMNLAQASGLVGNFFIESGGSNGDGSVPESSMLVGPNPSADSKKGTPDLKDGYKGIAQWGDESGGSGAPSRWSKEGRGLKSFAESNGKPWDDLEIQLRFIAWELGIGEVWNGNPGGDEAGSLEAIKGMTEMTAENAGKVAYTFEALYERCGCTQDKRARAGRDVFTYYQDKAPVSTPATPSTPATSPTPTGSKKTVVAIDPGHGATLPEYYDSVTKLGDRETNNDDPPGTGETTDVMDVSNQVKTQLEAAGYEVVLLRTDSSTPVSKRDRVKKAVDAKADIGISIHTDATGGLNQVWSQKVGSFRENINAGHERVEFSNAATATTSQKYADAFKTAREAAEGREVGRDPDSSSQAGAFSKDREGLFSWGNTPLIMLWADTIPWVYNEIARDNGRALSADLKQKYITGIVNGVKAAIPSTGTGSSADCTGASPAASGNFAQTVLNYVLPDYHAPNYTGSDKAKPEYVAAADKAVSEGRYVGNGASSWYADCGGFVTTLIVDSGHDTSYNKAESGGGGPTETQYAWLESHWQLLGRAEEIDVATLQPGDVWITRGRGHTFVYIGDVPGINSKAASASNMERVPMAASEKLTSAGNWYRKK